MTFKWGIIQKGIDIRFQCIVQLGVYIKVEKHVNIEFEEITTYKYADRQKFNVENTNESL